MFLIPFLVVVTTQAQNRKEVSADVKDVTVFLQRAQVFSLAKTNIGAGETEIAIINVPSQLDAASLQVEAKGNATLLGIRYENNYLEGKTKPKDVLMVEDSLESYNNQIRTVNDQVDIYHEGRKYDPGEPKHWRAERRDYGRLGRYGRLFPATSVFESGPIF